MGMEIFAERAKKLRESQFLSTRMLAEKIGISNVSISFYENCKREPTLSVLKAYANFFNTSVDYLIGLSNDPHRKGV